MIYWSLCQLPDIVYFIVNHSPTSPYDKNLFTEESARLVTGPVVSSDLITSRNGSETKTLYG